MDPIPSSRNRWEVPFRGSRSCETVRDDFYLNRIPTGGFLERKFGRAQIPINCTVQNLLRDYLHFLRTELEWWLFPFILILLALFGLAWWGESQPTFVYPLF